MIQTKIEASCSEGLCGLYRFSRHLGQNAEQPGPGHTDDPALSKEVGRVTPQVPFNLNFTVKLWAASG